MKIKAFLLIFGVVFSVFGQKTAKIDSLKEQLSYDQTLDSQVLTLLALAKIHQRSDKDSSRFYSDKALSIVKTLKNDSLLAATYFRQAFPEYYNSNDVKVLELYSKIDSLYELDKNLYQVYIETKIYRSEISKFKLTMEGVLQAKEYLLEGLELAQQYNDMYYQNKLKQRLATWHGFISQEVAPEKHLDSAKVLALEVLPYFIAQKDFFMTAKTYQTLAKVQSSLKNYQKMDSYEEKCRKYLRVLGDSMMIGESYYQTGASYFARSEKLKGIKYLDSAKMIYDSIGYPNDTQKKNLYRDYGYLYAQNGNYKEGYESMKKALVQSYTVYSNKNAKAAQEMEAKYEAQKKEKEIALLEAEKKTIEIQKSNQRNLFIAGIGVITLTGLFLFLALRNRQKTTKKLKELDTAKSKFFENISHEFRTPLALINGPIEEQLQKTNLEPQEIRNLTIAKNNSARLLNLVDQILDLSKLESDHYKLKVQKSNLASFLKAITSSFEYKAQTKNQVYEVDIAVDDQSHWFDRDVLEKIVNNLISNAIKYTPEQHQVTISAQKQQDILYLKVINTGVVLSEEELVNIFSRFHRSHETESGTGIGLALTKELVELHKGQIKASSDDSSTSFEVTIPVVQNAFNPEEIKEKTSILEEIQVAQKPVEPLSASKLVGDSQEENEDDPILLIVDDNAELREYLSSLFANDFTIKTAENGKEGFEKAQKYVPDVIITDLMMPNEDGLQLTKNSKIHQATSHIPVIMLTAKAGDESTLEGLETGADAYITKPFHTEILKTTVNNLLETRRKLQERFSKEVVLSPKEISVSSYDEQFLSQLQEVMDTSLIESNFNAEGFATALGMSRMQLHRKLKALTGFSTTEFIRNQRLKLAADLLKKSDINISQIGYAVGFNNHSYFTKCFKRTIWDVTFRIRKIHIV